jgi:hypothetical protein
VHLKLILIVEIVIIVLSFLVISCDSSKDSNAMWIYYSSDNNGCSYYYDTNSVKYLEKKNIVKVRKKIDCPGRKDRRTTMKLDCISGMHSESFGPSTQRYSSSRSSNTQLYSLLCNK